MHFSIIYSLVLCARFVTTKHLTLLCLLKATPQASIFGEILQAKAVSLHFLKWFPINGSLIYTPRKKALQIYEALEECSPQVLFFRAGSLTGNLLLADNLPEFMFRKFLSTFRPFSIFNYLRPFFRLCRSWCSTPRFTLFLILIQIYYGTFAWTPLKIIHFYLWAELNAIFLATQTIKLSWSWSKKFWCFRLGFLVFIRLAASLNYSIQWEGISSFVEMEDSSFEYEWFELLDNKAKKLLLRRTLKHQSR